MPVRVSKNDRNIGDNYINATPEQRSMTNILAGFSEIAKDACLDSDGNEVEDCNVNQMEIIKSQGKDAADNPGCVADGQINGISVNDLSDGDFANLGLNPHTRIQANKVETLIENIGENPTEEEVATPILTTSTTPFNVGR